mgnify:CR=1 FL=1
MKQRLSRFFGVGEKEEQRLEEEVKPNNNEEIIKIPICNIVPNRFQPRTVFNDERIAELAQTIHTHGIIQPIVVRKYEQDKYEIIAGERRFRAMQKLGWDMAPVIIKEFNDAETASVALIENLQREDLHFLEEAEGYEQLMEQFHLTQEAMASRVGKKQSTIANKLRLLKLSANIRAELRSAALTERHARALLKLKDEAQQLEVLAVVVKNGYNVRQTEQYIEKLLEEKQPEKKKRFVIVNDVRIYLNSIKQVVDTIKTAGIPCEMEQEFDGDEVVIQLRIKNQKKSKA